MNVKYISWETLGIMIEKLAEKIKNSNFNFDEIYGIPNNGTIIAITLVKLLNKKICYDIKCTKDSSKVLIVDDISDSGKTLSSILQDNTNVYTATLHVRKDTIVVPNIYIEDAEDFWIKYPWEINESNLRTSETENLQDPI